MSHQHSCRKASEYCWGNGITSVEAAHWDGVENVMLEDVWHSPRSQRQCCGTAEVVKEWEAYLSV